MISRNQEDHIVQVDTMLELSGGEDSDRFSKMSTQYGFITNKNRFVDAKEAMRIAVKAEQVGGILWKKVEARMLNDCGFIDRSKVKGKAIDETIKSYLEFPLKPEDLY